MSNLTQNVDVYLDLHDFSLQPLETKLLCLLKVGKKEHMESLAAGNIFCHHLAHYKNSQFAAEPFFDEHEGLMAVYQADKVNLKVSSKQLGQDVEVELDPGTQFVMSGNLHSPCFCLHAMHTAEWTHKEFPEEEAYLFKEYLQVPAEMGKFKNGDDAPYVWLPTNPNEFFDKLKSACDAAGIGITGDLVKYVDLKAFNGKVAKEKIGLVKQIRHKDEREYRIIFRGKNLDNPFTLQLGDLRNISMVMPLEEFKQKWELGFK